MFTDKQKIKNHNFYNSDWRECGIKKSAIQGVGVFANKNFVKDEVLFIVGDASIVLKMLEGRVKKPMSKKEDVEWMTNFGMKVNHQKKANAKIILVNQIYWLVAKQEIKKGSELTVNYTKLKFPFDNKIDNYKEL